VRAVLQQTPGRLDAVEARHLEVHDDDVGSELLCRPQGLVAVIIFVDEGRMVGVVGLALMAVAFLGIAWQYWTTEAPAIDVSGPSAPATETALAPPIETVTEAPEVVGT
jgi:hypothetical protein